jgi:hypothetical protein
MECQFCKKIFKNISSLNKHKKTAKYCLEVQGTFIEYKCECGKISNLKSIHDNHLKNCLYIINIELQKIIKEKDKIIKDKDEIIKDKDKIIHEKEIEIYKKQTEIYKNIPIEKNITNNNTTINNNTSTNNNCNNSSLNIQSGINFDNIDEITKLIKDYYDITYINNGQIGIAEFALQNCIKDENGNYKYICTDPSRHVFKHKDKNGNIIKDLEAQNLVKYLINGGLKDQALSRSEEWYTKDDGSCDKNKAEFSIKNCESILNLESDNTVFRKHLAKLTSV